MAKANVDIVLDCADPQKLAEFWSAALDYRELGAVDQYVVLVSKEGVKPPFILQGVPEPRNGKNRMHIDVLTDDVEQEASRLEGLGAKRVRATQEKHGTKWIPMADPESNEFCVCPGIEW